MRNYSKARAVVESYVRKSGRPATESEIHRDAKLMAANWLPEWNRQSVRLIESVKRRPRRQQPLDPALRRALGTLSEKAVAEVVGPDELRRQRVANLLGQTIDGGSGRLRLTESLRGGSVQTESGDEARSRRAQFLRS
jgi:hypothetical protein